MVKSKRVTHSGADSGDFQGNDRFELLGRIGAGGMGVVYQAHDKHRNTRVALKTLRTFTADGILRFKNEFRALQDLQHPNLVSLGELISEAGQWFFTMELVDGIDFLTWVRPVPGFQPSSGDFMVSPDAVTIPPHGGSAGYEAAAETVSRPELDENRLRTGLAQLARGLTALHAAGKVHRDIKPSNILVTGSGRVVVLDFGLATEVGGTPYSEVNVVGTADYMAPEQAASQPAGPPADWYSVGVLLYEALVGRLPYSGAPLEVLIAKQRGEPRAVREVEPDAPADLAALCSELLRRDPAARPSGGEVLRRLGEDASSELRLHTSSHAQATPFVGRARELQALKEAFATAREGKPVTAFVQGESGVGKTALARRFTERLRLEHPDVVVLHGRCYERESVPYKALDGIVDNLARFLMRLPKNQVASLLPLRVGLLAQVFPVLRRVESVAEAPLRAAGSIDPQELRTRVFAALRELFIRLTERQPVALVIDDLQWADADSQALLGALLQLPDAPALLLVATVRIAAEGKTPSQDAGRLPNLSQWISGDVRHVQVGRLPADEARQLAVQLMKRASPGASIADAQAIADEAHGHPLFIDELVRHSVQPTGSTQPGVQLHLEEALWARICKLDPPVLELLQLVTVAGRPLAVEVAARACTAEPSELGRHLGQLRVANLLRSTSGGAGRASDAIETYHDRVRTAVLLHVDEAGTRRLHERLAVALEASGESDPEALCTHWRGAGDDGRAAGYAAEAAVQAVAALAFDRAARLYQLALRLRPDGPTTVAWQERLGESLANVGRGGEAAIAYLAAAKHAHGTDAIELQRRAAEQLLVSGHIDEGLAGLRMVLHSVGLKLADTPRRALVSLLLGRARLRLRGLGFTEREESQVPGLELRRIDVCWSVAIGLGMVDTIRGSDFQTRHLLLALRAGEPYRIARALAMEGAFVASGGGPDRARAEKLLAAADTLAARIGHPHAIALSALSRGVMHFLDGDWRLAHGLCLHAHETLRERCTNVNWENNMATQFAMLSLAMMGEVAELSRHMPVLRRSARERGDLYAGSILRSGLLSLCAFAADDPERARQDIVEGLAKWSQQGFQLQHYWELQGKVSCDLYVGDGRTGLDRLTARWPVMARSLVLRIQFIRVQAHYLRGRARVATAVRLLPADPERAQLLTDAAGDVRVILSEDRRWSTPIGQLLEAGIAAARSDVPRAMVLLDQAERGLAAADMKLHAMCARRRRGELEGSTGRTLTQEADDWMDTQRIKDPRRMTAMFAPGFAD